MPAAECGLCLDVDYKSRRLYDYNAITYWLGVLGGTAQEAVVLPRGGLITAIEENLKQHSIRHVSLPLSCPSH